MRGPRKEELVEQLRGANLSWIGLHRILTAKLNDRLTFVGRRGKYQCWISDAEGPEGGFVLLTTREEGDTLRSTKLTPTVLLLEDFVGQWARWFPPSGNAGAYEDEIALQWLSFRAKETAWKLVNEQKEGA